jgi:hypothetical protein
MIAPFGQEAARANLSARQVQEAGLMMSGTCGPTGITSSASADLQSSLESRLRARTVSVGSTLYALTWKQRDTPLGRQICALRASVRRISDSGSGLLGWPTPRAGGNGHASAKRTEIRGNIEQAAILAGWMTPVVQDSKQSGLAPSGTGNSLKLSFEVQQAG